MRDRLAELHEQRGRLRERIAQQRVQLAAQLQPLRAPIELPGRIAAWVRLAGQRLREHPYAAGALVLGLVLLRPRLALRWTQRAWIAWRAWRSLRRWVPGFVVERLSSVLPRAGGPPRAR